MNKLSIIKLPIVTVLTSYSAKVMVKHSSYLKKTYPQLQTFGNAFDFDGLVVCVRAEISSNECLDWEYKFPFDEDKYWGWIPLFYFLDKKEGDIMNIILNNKEYSLRIDNSRRGEHKLEDCLCKITSSFGGIHLNQDGEPSIHEHMNLIYEAHVSYMNSINKKPIEFERFDCQKF